MNAITEDDDSVSIDPKRCIGCGICLSACGQSAISFVERDEVAVPPRDRDDTLNRILIERGLA